jgi:FtsP/CotA-like multicopper oxidase with cupredoxin domain
VDNDPVNWIDLRGLECSASDKAAQNKIDNLGKGNYSRFDSSNFINDGYQWDYVGDLTSMRYNYEDQIKSFAANIYDFTVTVTEREYSYQQRSAPTKPAAVSEGTSYFVELNNSERGLHAEFHDVNNDSWIDCYYESR